MTPRVRRTVDDVARILSTWDCIDTIAILESGEDFYDPYFFVSLDVFYKGQLPTLDERREALENAGAFESQEVHLKDRFLMDGIPVRLEYKDIDRYAELVSAAFEPRGAQRDTGTYVFYRLQQCQVLFSKSDWLEQVRDRLGELSNEFWERVRSAAQSRMEHYLSDLHAAAVRDENLFYLVSCAGFIRNYCSLLFAANKRFEPSARLMEQQVLELTNKPDAFGGRFDSFLRRDPRFTPMRTYELAELMAKAAMAL
ncbi:MAG: hypothetical protein ABR590_06450 [Spirochaetia bacterium]